MAKVTNDPAAVRLQLDSVNRRIEKHPLNSEKFTRARALMQESSVEHRETVSAALREQGLPEIGTQMRMMLFGLLPRSAKPPAAAVGCGALPKRSAGLTKNLRGPRALAQAFELTRCHVSNGRHVQ